MQYIGLIIIFVFFVQISFAFIKDIKEGLQKLNSNNSDEIERKRKVFIRGLVGIIIEVMILAYFVILLIYYGSHWLPKMKYIE